MAFVRQNVLIKFLLNLIKLLYLKDYYFPALIGKH